MIRVLVTGASGQLGRATVPVLRARHEVVTWGTVNGRRDVDLADAAAVAEALRRVAPAVVVHLAAAVRDVTEAVAERDAEAVDTLTVAAEAGGARRIVFASSAAVYGDRDPAPLAETRAPAPTSPYGRGKLAAEQRLSLSGLETVALRIFNVIGAGFPDSLVSRLAVATADAPVDLRGPDDFVRDYVHVDDVARAIDAAIDAALPSPHEIVNVGTGVATSNAMLASALDAVEGREYRLVPGPSSWSVADVTHAARMLGFIARRGPTGAPSPAL